MPPVSDSFARAQALLAAGRWRDARPLLEELAAQPSCAPVVVRQLAEIEIEDGRAEQALARLASLPAGEDETSFLVARAHAKLGRLDVAERGFLAVRARLPQPSAPLEMHLAALRQKKGDVAGTIEALRAAIAANPRLTAAPKNLAAILVSGGRLAEAREALAAAVDSNPGDASLAIRLARVQSDLGEGEAALASAERAAQAGQASAETWRDIGLLFGEFWRWPQADAALEQAERLEPGQPAAQSLRAVVKQELGDVEGARAVLASAAARDPGSLHVALGSRLLLPQIYRDVDDAAAWRARYTDGLGEVLAHVERWFPRANDVFTLNRTNFLLAYQGEDDRALQQGYSRVLAALARVARPEWCEPRPATFDGGRPLRIGFVSAIFRDCTAGRYFERWVTGLDPRRFERFVYHTAPLADAFTARIAAACEHFATVRGGVPEVAARLAADALDVIVQPEVGMTPLSYLLAALRLAPTQVAGWGHPVTTGSDAVDLYITCDAMEPADADLHYVERLLRLPGPGVDYAMPHVPAPAPRQAFGLPDDRRVYLCAQSLFKVHPRMDALFAELLDADPEAVLVFFQAPTRALTEQLAQRLQGAMRARGIPPRGQLKFLPRLGTEAFRQVLANVDVVLDTVGFSGGNTSLDAFAAGTPVVTLPGRFMRGRQTAGMLELMGVPGLVAGDAREYVELAVRAGRDRDFNAGLREAIRRGRTALFERPEPVAALGEALLAAAARRA